MTDIIQKLLTILVFLTVVPVNAQVLWTDNFDGYNTGTFTTGQGGWDVTASGSDIRIIAESGRGNVLVWGWNQFPLPTNYSAGECEKKGIAALWNTRTAGNNVLKLEFDFYSKDFTDAPGQLFQASVTFDVSASVFHCMVRANESYIDTNVTYPSAGNYKTAYNHTWIKVEVYIEYNAGTNTTYVCTYVPLLNYLGVHERKAFNILNSNALFLRGNVGQIYKAFMGALVKYDNFKLSAIPTLPTHISVGVNEQLAQKFNMYPNPATNVVNITNSENMVVNQVTVYDITGKQLRTHTFNNEAEIQLNVESLASGTYMLHLQTNKGLAVKKLVKK
jgi:hypothetical protein